MAFSVAGSSRSLAKLTVFSKHINVVHMMYILYCCCYIVKDDVVEIIINNIDQTSSDGACHYLDATILEVDIPCALQ